MAERVRTKCRKCSHRGFVEPTPDWLAREAWIDGKTLRCSACGHAWDGTDVEIVAALTEELICLPEVVK